MIGDPNWLYSTIAQSSAAIVAIIGGFITASVLMLLAEKRSLTNQRTDKQTRLNALKQKEKEAFETYETIRVEAFFETIVEDLKKEDELPPLEVLMQRYSNWNLNYEILKCEYEKLSKQRLEARHFIALNSDKIDPTQFLFFDDWVKANELDISSYDYELIKDEYNKCRDRKKEILEEEREKVEEEKRKATPPYLRGIFELQERFKLPVYNFIPPPSSQLTQIELYQRQKEDRRLEDLESRISSLRHEIFLLESEVTNLDTRLKAFSYPPNLGRGIVVLGYLAVFGILLPVLIMGYEAFFTWTKAFTIVSFWLGIIGVFAYVALQIRTLRR